VNLAIFFKYAVSFSRFIAVPVMVYLVAVMVCGRHGLWPSWFVAVMVCGRHGIGPYSVPESGNTANL